LANQTKSINIFQSFETKRAKEVRFYVKNLSLERGIVNNASLSNKINVYFNKEQFFQFTNNHRGKHEKAGGRHNCDK